METDPKKLRISAANFALEAYTLPWLISISLGVARVGCFGIVDHLRRRFARFKLGAHLLDLRRLFLHRCCEGRHARF